VEGGKKRKKNGDGRGFVGSQERRGEKKKKGSSFCRPPTEGKKRKRGGGEMHQGALPYENVAEVERGGKGGEKRGERG